MARRASPAAGPGRPRDTALSDAIMSATLDLIARQGFRDARLEDVAARVGTSKQALYRRWPDKSTLVADAVRSALARVNPTPPDTGSLRGDLVTLLGNTVRALTRTPLGGALAALVGETGDRALSRCLREVERDRRMLLRAILSRAADRGELAGGRDIELDIDALLGAIYFRLLVRRVALGPTLAAQVVDGWLHGAASATRRAP